MQELITAANVAGMTRGKVAGVRVVRAWTLLVVTSIERRGETNTVKAEFLDSLNHEATVFVCFSSAPIFEIGDFLSKKATEISFLHKETLTPIVFVVGGFVSLPQRVDVPPRSAPSRGPQALKKRVESGPKKKKGDGTKYEMTTSEMAHYHSDSVTVAELCAKLAPVVKTYAREGTRKPRDVSIRLNFDGHKTASGARWTPRLTHFLLGLIFLEPKVQHPKEGRQAKPTGVQAPRATAPRREDGPLTQEELVRRLSALGRVVVKGQ